MHSSRRQIRKTTRIGAGIYFVHGPESNWVVLHGDDSVSLIDTGYPADYALVLESIRSTGGDPQRLQTILVTHGHSDHIGNAALLADEFGCEVLCHPDELPNVRREELHQIGISDVLSNLYRAGVLGWTARAVRSGGLSDVATPSARAFDPREIIVASGHHVSVVPSAGHTPGHAAYWIERDRVLATGDCLVSAHPTSRLSGPQLLPAMFHSDPERAMRALAELRATDPIVIAPGHGPLVSVEGSFTAALVAATRTTVSSHWRLTDCSSSVIASAPARGRLTGVLAGIGAR